MPRAYGYIRFDGNPGEEMKTSLANQGDAIKQCYRAAYADMEWGGAYEEPPDVLLTHRDFHHRPAGKVLLRILRRGDILIVEKAGRLAFTLSKLTRMLKRFQSSGIDICIMEVPGMSRAVDTTNDHGKAFCFLLNVANMLTSEITTAGMVAGKAVSHRRIRSGKIQFGWKRNAETHALELDKRIVDECQRAHYMSTEWFSKADIRTALEKTYRWSRGEPFRPDDPSYSWKYSMKGIVLRLTFAVEVLGMPSNKLRSYTPDREWWKANRPSRDGQPVPITSLSHGTPVKYAN